MLNNEIMEILNGFWFILISCFLLVLITWMRAHKHEVATNSTLFHAIAALTLYFFGAAFIRGLVWFKRFMFNSFDIDIGWNALLIVAAVLPSWGLLCMIKVFTEKRWGHVAWVSSLGMAILFVTLTKLF